MKKRPACYRRAFRLSDLQLLANVFRTFCKPGGARLAVAASLLERGWPRAAVERALADPLPGYEPCAFTAAYGEVL